MTNVVVTYGTVQLRCKIVLWLILQLVLRGDIDGFAKYIIGKNAITLSEVLAQA